MKLGTLEVRLGPKNQVVIPKSIRETLQVREGDFLFFVVRGDTVTLHARPASFTEALRGLHKEIWGGEDVGGWLSGERDGWD